MKYTERIYSESEIKLIEEIFDMCIKQIYDEDLDKFINDCKEMFLESQKLLKEIERLNNIINELENILKRDIKACNNKFRRLILEEKLEQLQELKGSVSK